MLSAFIKNIKLPLSHVGIDGALLSIVNPIDFENWDAFFQYAALIILSVCSKYALSYIEYKFPIKKRNKKEDEEKK